MLALERGKAFVAAVPWILVDDHELIGSHAEVGVGSGVAEPVLDDAGFGRGGEQADHPLMIIA